MNEDTKTILSRLDSIEAEVKDIRLTLENETNRNIRLIAEGHPDLSNKPDEALKIDNEKEMLHIRINSLENEFRRIKEKVNNIA